jgi:hypothetical protein
MPDLLDGLRPPVASDGPSSRLHGFVEETLAGTGRAVWIEGGPGSGKTDLLAEALTQARAGGGQVAGSSAAHRPGPRLRLNPIMECLGLDPASRDLRRVLNAAAVRPVPEPRLGSRVGTGAAADRLTTMFLQLAQARPLVVAIDDLDLADPASLRVWARLTEQTERLPLLLLATARPGTDRPEIARVELDRIRAAGPVLRLPEHC